jgi:uncharacterized protein (DUF2236 family)
MGPSVRPGVAPAARGERLELARGIRTGSYPSWPALSTHRAAAPRGWLGRPPVGSSLARAVQDLLRLADASLRDSRMRPLRSLVDALRIRVRASVTGPFSHAPFPLEETLAYDGDAGLFGPESATWPVIGDAASFLGGVRALLVQAAHPEVVAGVADHSAYEQDPLGRLSRTSAFVTATAFGAMPEVERAVAVVALAHRCVAGVSHRGRPYAAGTPELAAWVHNALTDSFLVAHRRFGPGRCPSERADRFVREQTRVGRLLGAAPLPESAEALSGWIAQHPDVAPSPGMRQTVAFLRTPPLEGRVRSGYALLFHAAVASLPPRLRRVLGVRRIPGALLAGRLLVAYLRWALGGSPAWHLALLRCHARVPPGRFHQPIPAQRLAVRARAGSGVSVDALGFRRNPEPGG